MDNDGYKRDLECWWYGKDYINQQERLRKKMKDFAKNLAKDPEKAKEFLLKVGVTHN